MVTSFSCKSHGMFSNALLFLFRWTHTHSPNSSLYSHPNEVFGFSGRRLYSKSPDELFASISVNGTRVKIYEHYFENPVSQLKPPSGNRRVADLTGLKGRQNTILYFRYLKNSSKIYSSVCYIVEFLKSSYVWA